MNFGSKFLARHAQQLLHAVHIASDFTCVYCTAVGTIFGTTDVFELGFSYLPVSIFNQPSHKTHAQNCFVFNFYDFSSLELMNLSASVLNTASKINMCTFFNRRYFRNCIFRESLNNLKEYKFNIAFGIKGEEMMHFKIQ